MSEEDIEKRIRYLAMIRIFQRHITNFSSVHSDSLAEAQDLMQEVFANLWEKIDQLRPDSTQAQQNRWLHRVMVTTPGPYLVRIATPRGTVTKKLVVRRR